MLPSSDQTDSDSDGVGDVCDNCTLTANVAQCDGDSDGYGNHCDADFNNDLIVNNFDVGPFKAGLGTTDPVTDLNCDGITNNFDVGPFKAMLGTAPGPTGLIPRLDNRRPIAEAGPDQTVAVSQVVHLDGSGSTDLDGGPLTYYWVLASVPTGSTATLSDSHILQPTFVVDLAGIYQVELVVFDGTALSKTDTVEIRTDNSAPAAHAGSDRSALLGDTIALDGSGSTDVDGNLLNYYWSMLAIPPGSSASLSDSTALQPSLNIDLLGEYTASLVVNDSTLDSGPDTVTISTGNTPPVADAGPD